MNNQAKLKYSELKAPPMFGLKQASVKKKTKTVSRAMQHSLWKKLAQLKPCPNEKPFKKKRHREFGLCYEVSENQAILKLIYFLPKFISKGK